MDEIEQALWIGTYVAAVNRGGGEPHKEAENAVLAFRNACFLFDDDIPVPDEYEQTDVDLG